MLMLKQTVEHPSPDWNEPLYYGDENENQTLANLGSFDDMIHGHKEDLKLHVSVSWSMPQTRISSWLSTKWISFSADIEKKI